MIEAIVITSAGWMVFWLWTIWSFDSTNRQEIKRIHGELIDKLPSEQAKGLNNIFFKNDTPKMRMARNTKALHIKADNNDIALTIDERSNVIRLSQDDLEHFANQADMLNRQNMKNNTEKGDYFDEQI